jgi:hypothetical protein
MIVNQKRVTPLRQPQQSPGQEIQDPVLDSRFFPKRPSQVDRSRKFGNRNKLTNSRT